jgi:hypothetical protein
MESVVRDRALATDGVFWGFVGHRGSWEPTIGDFPMSFGGMYVHVY